MAPASVRSPEASSRGPRETEVPSRGIGRPGCASSPLLLISPAGERREQVPRRRRARTRVRAGFRRQSGAGGPLGAMDRAGLPPRPCLLGAVGRNGANRRSITDRPALARAVPTRDRPGRNRRRAGLHELEVVVAIRPEEGFGDLEGSRMVVGAELRRRRVDNGREAGQPWPRRPP